MTALHPLRHPAYRNLFLGQAISQFGDACYGILFLFYANKVTHSDAITGLVGASNGLPFILFGPGAGVLADRIDRRLIMLACDLISAMILLGLGAFAWYHGSLEVPLILCAAFLLSTVNSFFMPARSAILPRLVPREDLIAANGLATMSINSVYLLGLVLSTFVIGGIERIAPNLFLPLACLVNAATFLLSLFFVSRIPTVVPEKDSTEHPSFFSGLAQGLKVVGKDPVIRLALPVNGLNNLFIAGFMLVYIRSNVEWFGGHFSTLGLIEASFFLVLTLMTPVATKWPMKYPGVAYALSWASCGLLLIPMAWAHNYGVFLALNAACGLMLPYAWISMSTYLQAGFPDSVRGRVSSAWTTVANGVMPLGSAVMGGTLALLGLERTYIVVGVAIVAVTLPLLLVKSYRTKVMPLPSATSPQSDNLIA